MASSTIDPTDTISPSQITGDYVPASPLDFATPAPTSYTEGSPTPSEDGESNSSKRKRKSWGQPIPDYEKVLPPGKRAKTNEEKEQRRCERIVRNRRAAATSRDRKKHEFESLQLENQALKAELEQQRAIIAALQNGQPIPAFSTPVPFTSSTSQSHDALPTPAFSAVDSQAGSSAARASSPAISVISLPRAKHTSPTLAPSLFIKSEAPEDSTTFPSNIPDSFPELPLDNVDNAMNTFLDNPQLVLETFTNGLADSSLTQYPAVSTGISEADSKTQQQMGEQRPNHSADCSQRHIEYLLRQDDLGTDPGLDFVGMGLVNDTIMPNHHGHDSTFDSIFDYSAYDGEDFSSSLPDGLPAQTTVLQPSIGASH